MSWCKHHSTPRLLEGKCALGFDIEAMTTAQVGAETLGRHYMRPCHTSTEPGIKKATCEHRLLPTAEEIAAEEAKSAAAVAEFVKRLEVVGPWLEKIKSNHAKQDAAGGDDCPVCGKRILYRHFAYNGHVHARCETPNCLNFME